MYSAILVCDRRSARCQRMLDYDFDSQSIPSINFLKFIALLSGVRLMEFLGIKGTSKEEPKLADVKSASTLDMCNSSGNILYNTCNIALLSTNHNFIQYFEGCWFNWDIYQLLRGHSSIYTFECWHLEVNQLVGSVCFATIAIHLNKVGFHAGAEF